MLKRILFLLPLLIAACEPGSDNKPAPVFAITTASLPAAVAGIPYSHQLAATRNAGVSFGWADGFTPPAWLSLSTAGLLEGTPPAAGAFDLEFRAAENATVSATALRTLTLTVHDAPAIATAALARAIKGQPYNQALNFSAAPGLDAKFATDSPLPVGVSLSSGGALAGTPLQAGLYEVEMELRLGAHVVDICRLDLVVYESIPYTYVEDGLEPNDGTGTATQLFAQNTPPGRMTMADRHVQSEPLTLNSNANIAKPDPSDFFKFNIGHVGTITVEVCFRGLVGELDAYLWFYSGPPAHAVSIVAKSEISGDDERIVLHNAQLSAGLGAGFYYLEVRARGDAAQGLWNRNAYNFRVTLNDLTIVTEQLEADSAQGPVDLPVVALNQGVAPAAPQWSLVSGVLPAGVTFSADGRFAGTPSEFGLREFTVRIQDGAVSAERSISVRFFNSALGDYWQVRGESRLYNGAGNPLFEAWGDATLVAPHPDYGGEGAIYALGGMSGGPLDMLRVFHTDSPAVPAAKHFKFEDIGCNLPLALRYPGATYLQHSYGGYIYVVGGEAGLNGIAHAEGDFVADVWRLQVADGAGVALPHPLPGWEAVASLPLTHAGRTVKGWAEFGLAASDAGADADDRLYLVGGRVHVESGPGSGFFMKEFHDRVLMFEPPADAVSPGAWHVKTDAAEYTPRRFPAVAMIGGRIYIVAGREGSAGQSGSGGAPTAYIEMLQPDPTGANPALTVAGAGIFPALSQAVYYPMFATLNGSLYLWGGWDAGATGTRRLHRFDPAAGTLARLCDADWGTGFGGGVAHAGRLWLISGTGHFTESAHLNLCYEP